MKISLKDLRPNPYRDAAHYPIHREKIEALKASIRATGFWDNVVVRKADGEHFEIAYGQHRLEALKELVEERVIEADAEFDLPVRKLDDATMIQIMANENMNEYRATAEVVDDTVRVAREFLARESKTALTELTASDISQFLGGAFSEDKVTVSLQRLGLFDRGMINRDDLKGMSHTAARSVQREVAKLEKVMVKNRIDSIQDTDGEEPTNQERKRVRAQVQKVANHVAHALTQHIKDGGSLGEVKERSIDAQVEMIPEDAKPTEKVLSTIDAAAKTLSAREFKRKVEMIAKYRDFMSHDAREDIIAHLKELSIWCKNTSALFETASS